MVMVVRRKTIVFLVRFMFICEAVWIIVNFLYLRKLFRAISLKLLVTSTGKTNISPRVETTWSRTNDLQHWTRWQAIREWCHTAVHCYGTAPKYKRCFHEMISLWKTNFLPERLNTLNTILLFLFHKSHVSKNIDQLLRLTVCWNLISCNFASWPWVGQVMAR